MLAFPSVVNLNGNDYHLEQLSNGIIYRRQGLDIPYVFIARVTQQDAGSWFAVSGAYRVRVSRHQLAAEFVRGAPNPYVVRDHMVKQVGADAETTAFSNVFWAALNAQSGR